MCDWKGLMTNSGFMERVKAFLACENGAVAIEYVVIAAAMFLALIPSFLYVASGMTAKFSSIGGYFGGS
jgi:Flp pilus assembly pilin Flp